MNKVIFAAMISLACLSAQTATDPNSKSDESSNSSYGGTVGPVLKLSKLGTGIMTSMGGRINATFFKMLLVGIGGYGALGHSKLEIDGKAEDVSYYHGALGIGVRLFPDSFIHLTSYNGFGLGHLNLKQRGEKGLAFSIEPELNAEFDLFSLVRFGAGMSYRFLFSKSVTVPSSALSGIGGQVYVEFGWL